MEIPARNFYRYLLLCGYDLLGIEEIFANNMLVLPPDKRGYYSTQLEWATSKDLGHTVPTALRRTGLYDMWAAHRCKRAGTACAYAFQLSAMKPTRGPLEALLIAGWQDTEISKALSRAHNHYINVSAEEISAFRKHFFDPSILDAESRSYLVMREPHLRIAMLALDSSLLMFALGLRFNMSTDIVDYGYKAAWKTWILHLETMPWRVDREGLKSLSTFLSTIKSLDRSATAAEDVPLLNIARGAHTKLEQGL
jgi:hypothetical protein